MSEAESTLAPAPQPKRLASNRLVALVVLAIAGSFVVLSSVQLEAQGLHGDELHQATASFAFRSRHPEIFRGLSIEGIPVLNMPYSGAIKSALYATYLELPGASFSVVSWRMLGILFSAVGIAGFGLLVGRRLELSASSLFLVLVATDGMVVLGSRHDWGPIALALLLRMLLLAVWLRGERADALSPTNSFWIGLIAGIALFEKLSNVALIAVLPVLFALSPGRRTLTHAGALVGGLGLGALPLAAANLYTYWRDGLLVSLSPKMLRSQAPELQWGDYLHRYSNLGAGGEARHFILGGPGPAEAPSLEAFALWTLILATAAAAATFWKRSDLLRSAAALLLCYVGIAVVIYAFPRVTWVHHWVIGTPFQYLAFALTLAGLGRLARERPETRTRWWMRTYVALVIGFLLVRSVSLISLEKSLLTGDAAQHWTPSTVRFGELMSEEVDGGILITAGWGLAPQAYCFSGGARNFVHDLFWTYRRPSEIKNRLDTLKARALFVARPEWWSIVDHSRGVRMWRDLDTIDSWAPDWREVPVSDELGELEWISVRKFVRDQAGSSLRSSGRPFRAGSGG